MGKCVTENEIKKNYRMNSRNHVVSLQFINIAKVNMVKQRVQFYKKESDLWLGKIDSIYTFGCIQSNQNIMVGCAEDVKCILYVLKLQCVKQHCILCLTKFALAFMYLCCFPAASFTH